MVTTIAMLFVACWFRFNFRPIMYVFLLFSGKTHFANCKEDQTEKILNLKVTILLHLGNQNCGSGKIIERNLFTFSYCHANSQLQNR